MGRLLDSDLDPHDEPQSGQDRDISLGTATVLGIFFLLVLICAGFFGFGYTLGRKSMQGEPVSAVATASQVAHANKPTAGSTVPAPPPIASGDSGIESAPPAATKAGAEENRPAGAETPAPVEKKASIADFLAPEKPAPPPKPAPVKPVVVVKPATLAPAVNPGTTGNFMVQIAAVSSQDTADILLSELKKKGYNVQVRHEPQDQLMHIQVGPFANRKDAVEMQQKILGDGFNAIVKP
jgi:cell division septation protein DedD